MLKIKNVSKSFNIGTVNEKQALKNINLHLKPQDFEAEKNFEKIEKKC